MFLAPVVTGLKVGPRMARPDRYVQVCLGRHHALERRRFADFRAAAPQQGDFFQHVVERFRDPFWTGFYVRVMLFLGLHLKHVALGWLLALCLAAGFVVLPVYLHSRL